MMPCPFTKLWKIRTFGALASMKMSQAQSVESSVPKPSHSWLPVRKRLDLNGTRIMLLAGVMLITLLVYLRCLGNELVYDDHPMIVDNPYLRQWSFVWKSITRDVWWFLSSERMTHSAYYRPLENVWIGLGYQLVGLNPVGWHCLKISLHLIVVMLSFRLAQLLTGSFGTALFTALTFGILPVHAEAVVWATAIPEPLSAAFELGALCSYIQSPHVGRRRLLWPLVLFGLALLSHESAVVFPLLVAAYVFLLDTSSRPAPDEPSRWTSLGGRARETVVRSAPFFGVALLYMGLRAIVLGPDWILGFTHTNTTASMATGKLVLQHTPVDHTLGQTLLTIPGVLVEYLKLLAMPWLIGPAHDVKFVTTAASESFYVPAAILALLGLTGYVAFRKDRRAGLYLFCAIWWLVTLAPVLSLNQIVATVGDRYEYLSSFAFCLLIADWVSRAAQLSVARTRMLTALAATIAALWMMILWRIQPVWHDDLTMFTRCVEMCPDSARYHQALSAILMKREDFTGAAAQLADAARLAPADAGTHLTLGMMYLKLHRDADAKREMEAYYHILFNQKKTAAKPHWYVEFK
jgi:protein O-mannosyl-transferase